MIITDKNEIKKIFGFTNANSMPDSFLPKELKSFGKIKYIGNKHHKSLTISLEEYFDIGKTYFVYKYDSLSFVIGNDGIGKKIIPAFFGKLKYL